MSKTVNRPNYLIKGELQTDLPFISLAHVTISKEKKNFMQGVFLVFLQLPNFSTENFEKNTHGGKTKNGPNDAFDQYTSFTFICFTFQERAP